MSDRKARAYVIAGLATLIWSINYIFAKHALREFPPMLASGLRTGIAALVMVPVYFWHLRGREQPQFTLRDLSVLLGLGVLGVGLNQMLFVLGISRTTVSHAAILVGLTPVIVLLVATLLGQERIHPMQLAGMLTALAGVVVLQLSSAEQHQGSLTGDLLIFMGGVTFAILAVCGKRESTRLGPIVLNAWAYMASAVALLPVTLWYSQTFSYQDVTWVGWVSLFYMAAFSSVLGYLLFYYALTQIPASRVTTFGYLQPLIGVILAMIFLGERLTVPLLSGGALVLAGVFVAERT